MPALRKPKPFQWLLLVGFLFSLGIALFYGARTYRRAEYWREHRDEPLRAWMNAGYVARSYAISPPRLCTVLRLQAHPPDRRPLGMIAKSRQQTAEAMLIEVEAAIARIRATADSGKAAAP